jgi:2-aminoethylphosphonate transport system permease protein
MAASLGARPAYSLRHVLLPMVLPYPIGVFGSSFALSMGGLGATMCRGVVQTVKLVPA